VESRLFDPLKALECEGCRLHLEEGRVILEYGACSTSKARAQVGRILTAYEPLLRIQFDVPPGDRPRTVQQLLAVGRIEVREGMYRRRG
jgi:hypothetical protein